MQALTALPLAYFTSPQDWMIIGIVILVLFGGTKIPQLARGFGEGIREFKKSINAIDEPLAQPAPAMATTTGTSGGADAE